MNERAKTHDELTVEKWKQRKAQTYDYLEARQKALASFASRKGLRLDWHAPDESGVTAVVKGSSFDNAFGDDGGDRNGKQIEKVVILRCEQTGEELRINLATLCAIATYQLRDVRPILYED